MVIFVPVTVLRDNILRIQRLAQESKANASFVSFDVMHLTELLCLGVRGQAQENESASLPNTERTEELGGAPSTGRGG